MTRKWLWRLEPPPFLALLAPRAPGGIAFQDLEKGERNIENKGTETMMFFLPATSVKTKLSSAEASGVLFGRSFGRNPSAENTRSSVLAEASVMTEGSLHDRRFGAFWGQNC